MYHSQQPPKHHWEESVLNSLTLLCALAYGKNNLKAPTNQSQQEFSQNNIQLQKCRKPVMCFLPEEEKEIQLTPFGHWFELLEEQLSWGENFMNGSYCIDLVWWLEQTWVHRSSVFIWSTNKYRSNEIGSVLIIIQPLGIDEYCFKLAIIILQSQCYNRS